MKAQFLKIAKCKDEKSFYKKYPTQEAFFKAHPEARSIKKAQIGAYIGGDGPTSNAKPINYQEYYDDADKLITGSTEKERQEAEAARAKAAADNKGGGGGFDISSIMGMIGGEGGGEGGAEGLMSMFGGARYGKHIPKAQVGINAPTMQTTGYTFGQQSPWGMQSVPSGVSSGQPAVGTLTGGTQISASQAANQPVVSNATVDQTPQQGGDFLNTAMSAMPVIGGLVNGIKALGAEKEAAKAAKQQKTVSGLQLIASTTRPEQIQRRYVRPEDVAIQPNQMFPTYGVGTNVLAKDGVRLKGGGEIQNTYAPGYLYDNLGYEPLNDSNVKQYYRGGGIPKAQSGFSNYMNTLNGGGSGFSGAGASGSTPWGAIGGIGSNVANSAAGGGNAGGQIGGSIGEGLGAAFGPAGMAIGKTFGTALGNAVDPYAKAIKRDQAATKRNIENISYNNMASSFTAPYQAHARDGRDIANYEEGGWVSHDWQPQVISSFGGLNEQEVYDYAHDGMESLRAGGHIRGEYQPISNRGMEQYSMGGEVQTTWGGHAETISHNPYMPGTGETIMFRGKSHDESDGNGNTGIGVKYGKGNHDSYTDYAEYGTQEADADVEVERGEPAAELQDANGEKNLTVYGNLKIPNQYLDLLGDPKAKGKKFKNYVNDLSKIETKQNKIVEDSTNKLNALNVQNSFDKLKLTSLQASIQGANMKLKDIAEKKTNAAYLQNAINDTAEENGLVADDLARGKVKIDKEAMQEYAEYGKTIKKAKDGVTTDDKGKKITKAEKERLIKSGEYKVDPSNPNKIYKVKSKAATSEQKKSASAMDKIPLQKLDKNTGFAGGVTKEKFEEFKKRFPDYPGIDKLDPKDPISLHDFKTWANNKAKEMGSNARIMDDPKTEKNPQGLPIFGNQYLSFTIDESKKETPSATESDYLEVEDEDKVYPVEAQKRNRWIDLAGQVLPFFRPSDQEAFDYAQLYPEMYALGSNQLEPVQAQGYQPDLATPYDISYQDQLNANQADYNSMQKLVGYNPAAQSVLAAQKYAANTGVLGEQFRANQAMQAGVYNQNRQVLNDAKLKNLDIYDRQYQRQEQAKSNTKAITQAALNSIGDKYAKNKLENRELGIYENLYNYRYDPQGRAINMNAPWQANLPNVYNKGNQTANMREVYDKQGNFLRYEPIEETKTVTNDTLEAAGKTTGIGDKKNGGKVKAKNGSIVSAYKNL